jgi:hypothetical protein
VKLIFERAIAALLINQRSQQNSPESRWRDPGPSLNRYKSNQMAMAIQNSGTVTDSEPFTPP